MSAASPSRDLSSSYPLGPILGIQAIEVLTGIGLALAGAALPALASAWHLDDAASGRLLLATFAGASVGALFIGNSRYSRSVAWGMALIALTSAGMAFASPPPVFLLGLLFGIGLGVAMTANSLLTGVRYPERRAAMLTLLNFSWSAGAALSPLVARALLLRGGVRMLFLGIALFALLGSAGALRFATGPRPFAASSGSAARVSSSGWVVGFFCVFVVLYCGSEAVLSGWVLTYVHRLGFRASAPALAASCFWLALLAGRAVAPAVLLRMREERLLALALPGGVAGVAGLLMLRLFPAMMVSAALAGLCFAPVFPICVSLLMALAADARQARWMFAVAGVGSALFPWITGRIATATGSLHTGLLLPLIALGAMLVMLYWPGGGMDLFRRLTRDPGAAPLASEAGVLPSL